MKKHQGLTLITAALLLTGCGSAEVQKDGTYVNINGTYNYNDDFRSDPDAAISKVIAETDPEPSDTITLENGKFTIKQNLSANSAVTWNGSYAFDNAVLKFGYEGADQSAFADRIPKLNETGSYPSPVMPRVYLSDSAIYSSKLPVFLFREKDAPAVIERHGDFLCVPAYGFKLDGSYEGSADFAVNYDVEEAMREDRYSEAYYDLDIEAYTEQISEESVEAGLSMMRLRYNIAPEEPLRFRLQFSGGKWEMTANDGSAFNHGYYAESKQHPGFIAMYPDPEDAGTPGIMKNIYPLFLYIDGYSIYYPGFVRK